MTDLGHVFIFLLDEASGVVRLTIPLSGNSSVR